MWRAFSSRGAQRLGRAGTSSLEFAIILLAFLILLLGTTDVARYLFTLQSMQTLANQAARYGSLPTNSTSYLSPSCPVDLTALPFTPPPFLDSSAQLCVAIGNDATSGASTVTATVTSSFTAFTPGFSALTTTGVSTLSVATELKY